MIRSLSILLLLASSAWGVYRTPNFEVNAPSSKWEKAVGDAAEQQRKELASLWLGEELPQWPEPCKIRVVFAKANSGSTTFGFDNGRAFGFDMTLRGTPERMVDSVLAHELTHTILATHFGQPFPRWADEGAASSVEHSVERENWERSIIKCLQTRRGVNFRDLFTAVDYPPDYEAFYAHGYSVSSWLILKSGHRDLVRFIGEAYRTHSWTKAANAVYGFASLLDMQNAWLAWLKATPGPVRYAAGQCGSCGQCYGGQCVIRGGWQPANRVIVPVQPWNDNTPVPNAKTPEVPPEPTPAWQANCEKQSADIAALRLEIDGLRKQIAGYKECNCGDAHVKLQQQVAASNVTIQNTLVALNAARKELENIKPQPPDYDAITAEVAKRLPPINMRVTPEAPYQSVKLGSYVTLPLDKQNP